MAQGLACTQAHEPSPLELHRPIKPVAHCERPVSGHQAPNATITHRMKAHAPPTAVAVAAWLFVAYGILSLVRIWIFGSGLPASYPGIAIWISALAGFAFVARALYLGRNWLRWLVALLVGSAIVLLPLYKPDMPDGPQLVFYLLQFAMPVVASALTFTPRANDWFSA